jgi:carbamoyltransferase
VRVIGVEIGHDSSACLVEDGRIVRYAAEERFNRIKVGVNTPHESLFWCLGDYKQNEIDHFVSSNGMIGTVGALFRVLMKRSQALGTPISIRPKTLDIQNVYLWDHHLSHAAGSYYTSGFQKALIVVLDGIGEETTQSIYVANGKEIKAIQVINTSGIYTKNDDGTFKEELFPKKTFKSLGWFYGSVTEALGWRMCCDEGKTMGLAPYGDPTVIPEGMVREKMFEFGRAGFYANDGRCYYHFENSDYFRGLAEKYGKENLAASAQKILEDDAIAIIKGWIEKTGERNLCVSGGVFMNVKLNQRIAEECGLEGFWPFPLCGDTGLSIGSALLEYWKRTKEDYRPERIRHLYYGPGYTDEEIKAVLDLAKLDYRPYDVKYVAGKMADNKIVGWFQGRMEGGPRALGGRSILMSPLRAENKDIINAQVKFREGFRPFCPSVTADTASRYFDGGGEFMITACKVKTDDIPAVTHVDKTARPQFVDKDINPKYHELLSEFGAITGHPVLLNTSLNIMGEPICMTPKQAVQCFYGGGLDLMVLGNYMIEKAVRA